VLCTVRGSERLAARLLHINLTILIVTINSLKEELTVEGVHGQFVRMWL
jgi:hypothetical protein